MAYLDSSHGLQRRVLVPILIVGGLLCFAQSVSLEGAGSARALAALTSTGLTTWIIAGWVALRGVSSRSMFALCLWADAAIVTIDLSRAAGHGELTALAMFALPSVMTGLYGPAWMMTTQALAVAGGSVTVLQRLDLSVTDLLIQSGGTLLATISPAVAVLVLRRRLDAALAREHRLGITDPLTLMTNRRGLAAAIPEVLARAQATLLPIGLAVIDVDHFKKVNDRYGHSVGDAVLQQIAALIRECLRAEDVVCRLGGEEFAVLAAISPDHLCALGERIREGVERCAPYRITVSVGATWSAPSDVPPSEPEQVWALLDRADELMYLAKNDGRNRLRAATSDKGTHPSNSGQGTMGSRAQRDPENPEDVEGVEDLLMGSGRAMASGSRENAGRAAERRG